MKTIFVCSLLLGLSFSFQSFLFGMTHDLSLLKKNTKISMLGFFIKGVKDLLVVPQNTDPRVKFYLLHLQKNSTNVKDIEGDFYDLFQVLKKDFQIKENVSLKFYRGKLFLKKNDIALYIPLNQTIYLNHNFFMNFIKKFKKSFFYPYVIFILRHELEHHRQNCKYQNSYHGNNPRLQEHGADTAAAKAFNCCQCLKINQSASSKSSGLGYWTHQKFSKRIKELVKNQDKPFCKGCLTDSTDWRDFL